MARFLRKGTTKIRFVTTIANKSAPKITEYNDGTILDTQVNEVSGFAFSNNPINTMSMDTDFVSQISGENTVEQSSLTFYDDDTGASVIKTNLAKGTEGFVIFAVNGVSGTPAKSGSPSRPADPLGVKAGDTVEVWPVEVSANVNLYTVSNEAAMFRVDFAVTAEPSTAKAV